MRDEIHLMLVSNGWEPQDIPGLWRHAWKGNGLELTTMQALRVETQAAAWRR